MRTERVLRCEAAMALWQTECLRLCWGSWCFCFKEPSCANETLAVFFSFCYEVFHNVS